MDEEAWLPIGTITAPQGLKGEIRVYPATDFPERFTQPGDRWLLRSGSTEPTPVTLLAGRFVANKGIYIIRLDAATNRAEAEALRGSELLVPASDRPPLAPGEFHSLDLIGLSVFEQHSQTRIGVVIDILSAGNDLLEVRLEPGSDADPSAVGHPSDSQHHDKPTKVLIPFVNAIVPLVDLERRRLEIVPPVGLLDLPSP